MTILDRVEASLADFRPKNQREFVSLQIARRFDDTAAMMPCASPRPPGIDQKTADRPQLGTPARM